MDFDFLDFYLARYKAILFDVGNTLVVQNNPNTEIEKLKVELLPGVSELVERLADHFQLAIVSNTTELGSKDLIALLDRVGISQYFNYCLATSEFKIHKPNPEPILHTLEKLQVAPQEALYVGDSELDFLAARNAKMDFLYTQRNIQNSFSHFAKDPDFAFKRALRSEVTYSSTRENTAMNEFDGLVKPPKSLGAIEDLISQICAITDSDMPSIDPAAVAVFAADHGIGASDVVTPWPQTVTLTMTDLMAKRKAAISIISEMNDVYLQVINVGTVEKNLNLLVRDERVSAGTKDFRFFEAMTLEETEAAIEVGARTAERLVAGGSRSLSCGEVGIGNTTAASILIAHYSEKSAIEATGKGSGIDDETYKRKVEIVSSQLEKIQELEDPIKILAAVGGLEIAALVGYILRGATLKVPVILDGVITLSAALVAYQLKPEIRTSLIAGHRSFEPGAKYALQKLGLNPILEMDLRLGEGTGAVLAVPILRAGCSLFAKMGRLQEVL